MDISSFVDKIKKEKDFLSSFVRNPEKTIHDFFGDLIDEKDKKELLVLHKNISETIENTVLKYYDSGESKYAKGSKAKFNNDQMATNDPQYCTYSSGCTYWECADTSTSCRDSENCYDINTCMNIVSGGTCQPTDQNGCLDSLCSNLVVANNFCIDQLNCIDSQCHNLHCGDQGHCSDEMQCTNTVECVDSGMGGCTDSGCHNGSVSGDTKCSDLTTCIDDTNCTNVGSECSDSGGCQDDPGCSNTVNCTDLVGCTDRGCVNDKCSDTAPCVNSQGCSDNQCTHGGGVPPATCTDYGCHDNSC
jgi:hypothetical protein